MFHDLFVDAVRETEDDMLFYVRDKTPASGDRDVSLRLGSVRRYPTFDFLNFHC